MNKKLSFTFRIRSHLLRAPYLPLPLPLTSSPHVPRELFFSFATLPRSFSNWYSGNGPSSSGTYGSNCSQGPHGFRKMPPPPHMIPALASPAPLSYCSAMYTTSPASPAAAAELAARDALIARNIFKADEENKYLSSQDVEYEELSALLLSGRTRGNAGCGPDVLLVDVRSEDEVKASGRIPTACSIPIDELEDALELPAMQFKLMYQVSKPPRESAKIIFYCRAGTRARRACELARKHGFRHVRNYVRSFEEWSTRSLQSGNSTTAANSNVCSSSKGSPIQE